MNQLVLIDVESEAIGHLVVELDNSDVIDGPARVLELLMLNMETRKKVRLNFIITKASGPALIQALLTESQWEAVRSV